MAFDPWYMIPGYGQYKGAQNAAGSPYEDAAAGLRGLAPEIKAFSDTQWNRQMGGLDKAQGYLGDAMNYWQSAYGSRGPGAMENAWSQVGNKYLNPTASSGALNDYQRFMGQGPMSYDFANRASGLAGGQVDYSGLSNQLAGSGQASQFWAQNQGRFGAPGAAESWWAQNQGTFNRPAASREVYDQFGAQLYGPGRAEQFQVTGPSWGSTDEKIATAMGYAQQAQAPTRLEGAQGAEVGNLYRGANNVNQFAGSAMPQLQGRGVYEQFVESDIYGNNPAMEMERRKGLASINQEMARRGHFNSGGANTAIGEFLGTLGAKTYEGRAQRAQQAQGMQLSRLGEGRQLAQAGSGERMGQAQGLQGLASTQDAQRLDRQQFGANTALSAADKNIAQQNTNLQAEQLKLQAAANADSSRNARLQTLQGMASAGDDAWMRQQQLAGQFANQAQSAELARLMGGMNAGNMADQGQLARLMAQFQMGSQANDQNLARGKFQFDMGQGLDATNLARYGMLGQFSNMADTNNRAALDSYFRAAGGAQDAESARLRDAMSSLSQLAGGQANLVAGFYGAGGQLSGQSFSDYINALANAYSLQAQGGAARAQVPFQLANMGIQGYKAFAAPGVG